MVTITFITTSIEDILVADEITSSDGLFTVTFKAVSLRIAEMIVKDLMWSSNVSKIVVERA